MAQEPTDAIEPRPGDPGALRRMRLIATGSLAGAAAVYFGLGLAPQTWTVSAVRAAAEAAMVGGIADWFAVVALFRHPLGLPIPHTAIVPASKDRIGIAIGRFVQTHLLDPAGVSRRVEVADVSAALADWLRKDDNIRRVAEEVATALPGWLAHIDDSWLSDRVKATLRRFLQEIEPAAAADEALAALLDRGEHLAVIDAVSVAALDWLEAERPRIEAQIDEHLTRYAASYLRGSILHVLGVNPVRAAGRLIPPKGVRDLTDGIVAGLGDYLRRAREPGSEVREGLDALIRGRLDELRTSEAWSGKLEALRAGLLAHPEFDRRFDTVWAGLREQLVEALTGSREAAVAEIARVLGAAAEAVAEDDALRAALNEQLRAAVSGAVSRYRHEVGSFVADTVRRWDAQTLTRIVEQTVGRDLQFVRINGTVVGALVGLALFLLGSLGSLL